MGAVMLRPGKKTQWVSSSLAKIILRHLSSRHLAYNFRGGLWKMSLQLVHSFLSSF